MSDKRIADLFRVRKRFLRSAHLERDFEDPKALAGYVLTPQAAQYLDRLTSGLAPESGQRAWRITGDYGVGKSSFALVLAHLLGGRARGAADILRDKVDSSHFVGRKPKLLPVLVTGSRESVERAVLRGILEALSRNAGSVRRTKFGERIQTLLETPRDRDIATSDVIKSVEEAVTFVRASGHASGVLLILDELGKFLEFAATNPDRQDIYFLQALAETASRSGNEPLVVVGLLHQGFNAYADRLSETAQREWQKVAGRFEELLFDRPLDQTAALIIDALNIPTEALPKAAVKRAKEDMASVTRLGWYGPTRKVHELIPIAPGLYPLHPSVLPVLTRLFSRFGQNERSLFSFILSNEPFGLQAFAQQHPSATRFYRIADLYDYSRATFGQRLSLQSYRSHWNQVESIVESYPAEYATELQVLKTVAMLNLIDDQGLLASASAIEISVCSDDRNRLQVRDAISKLAKKRILYLRGTSGGYCLWPHTSVNIEKAYEEANKAIGTIEKVSALVAGDLDSRPIVARRHYIETGNLRHFIVRCVGVSELESAFNSFKLPSADGLILLALCETEDDRKLSRQFACSPSVSSRHEVLVAIPKPLAMLRSAIQETRRWEWVARNTPELNLDRYAAEEVSRQLIAAKRILRDRIQDLVGLRTFTGGTELEWFQRGEPIRKIASSRDLLSHISKTCDTLYPDAPKIRNELINRRQLSSAAAGARMRLIEKLFSSPSSALLGMDPTKKPPEMSMYLSVLQRGKIHTLTSGNFEVTEPIEGNDPLNVRPCLNHIVAFLRKNGDTKVNVLKLFEELRLPPFGVRDGLLPLLLAVFAVVHEQELAFYEDGNFLQRTSGDEFMRLVKEPASFELQFCRIEGVRSSVFSELLRILKPGATPAAQPNVLDVVRPLCQFAAQLPQYTHRTRRVSVEAMRVRACLLAAKEPSPLIFRELPEACGFLPFESATAENEATVRDFVSALKRAIDELRSVYPALLEQMQTQVQSAFDRSGPFSTVRDELASVADRLVGTVHDTRLRGFCLRFSDRALSELDWLSAFGGYISAKPPILWTDSDADRFQEELNRLAQLFRRVEAANFQAPVERDAFAIRVSLTLRDGSDVQRVMRLNPEEVIETRELETAIREVLQRSTRLGLVAASRVLMEEMSKDSTSPTSEDGQLG